MKLLYAKDTAPDEVRPRFGGAYEKVERDVAAILKDVRQNRDEALLRYTEKFDGAKLDSLEVSGAERERAAASVDPALLAALEQAAENIRAFHLRQKREGFAVSECAGVLMGQRVLPLARAGLYIPGGTARYPSTVLMNAIPAKIAGVPEIILVTPPQQDGSVPASILAAAELAGVSRIFRVGGSQAIGALAYGTESVPRVDKITGPGNLYVATAKRMVYGLTDIDMVAGPSEVLIIADESANPRFLAADLLAQAEHDPMAAGILLTVSEKLARETIEEVERQLALLPRREIAERSVCGNGRVVIVPSVEEAVAWSNEIAPEHLELCVSDPFSLLGLVRNAGSVFLGHYTPEALGDYIAGPNHTLPTNGTARFSSPLSVDDFIKKSSFLYYSREALSGVCEKIGILAQSEGLAAHANSATIRFDKADKAGKADKERESL